MLCPAPATRDDRHPGMRLRQPLLVGLGERGRLARGEHGDRNVDRRPHVGAGQQRPVDDRVEHRRVEVQARVRPRRQCLRCQPLGVRLGGQPSQGLRLRRRLGLPRQHQLPQLQEVRDRLVGRVPGRLAAVQRRVLEERPQHELRYPLRRPPRRDAAQRVPDQHRRPDLREHGGDVGEVVRDQICARRARRGPVAAEVRSDDPVARHGVRQPVIGRAAPGDPVQEDDGHGAHVASSVKRTGSSSPPTRSR